ncbi:unnamed protein product [Aspergillus oryzae]|uniref:Unnamed protein product n=1 Tax=Aspergillus oryzae TaxID=5062 RepID=A0AAN4YRH5_ASPOZ|nr:unnamed protein product [Aspergillus oryzae]
MFGIPGPDGSFPHHPSFAAAAGTDDAHVEAVVVGKSLAMIGWEMITDEALFKQAKSQWENYAAWDSAVTQLSSNILKAVDDLDFLDLGPEKLSFSKEGILYPEFPNTQGIA